MDKEKLYNFYIVRRLSTYKIAKIFNCSNVTVGNWLKKFNIKIRPCSERQKGRVSPMKGRNHTKESNEKNRLKHIGKFKGDKHPLFNKKHSIESRIKMSLSKGGNGELNRVNDRYPPIFYRLKEKIKIRDNFTCQNCKLSNKDSINKYKCGLNIHHIDYNKQNCEESNLITVCHSCNTVANGDRDYWFAYYAYLMENKNE